MWIVLYGKDASRIEMKLEEIKKQNKEKERIEFDANSDPQERLLNELDSSNLFGEGRLMMIRHADFLGRSKKEKGAAYEIKEFQKRKESEDVIVFVLEQESLSQKKEVKAFLQDCRLVACKALDAKNQRSYIQTCLKEEKVEMEKEAFDWFCAHVGFHAQKIHQEVEKLAIFGSKIGREDVQALVSSEPIEDVFKMSDALFERNGLRLIAFYRNFRQQNMETVQIIALLSSQIRFLFQVRVLMDQGKNKEQIVQELKAHPYRIQLMMEKARRFSADSLLKQLSLLADLDHALKTGKIDRDEGFENFALSLNLNE